MVCAFSFPALLVTAIFLLNPLGIQDAAEQQYQDNVNAFLSPFYPNRNKKVSVVLLDQSFVKKSDGYPLSFSHLRNLHKTIASFSPQAVFYDFLLHEEHSKNLDRLTREFERRQIPVVLASNSEYDAMVFENAIAYPEQYPIRQKLYAATQTVLSERNIEKSAPLASVVWSGYGDYYPLVLEEYQHTIDDQSIPNVSQSPAWALFGIHCELAQQQSLSKSMDKNTSDANNPELSALCQQLIESNSIPDPMLIRWNHSYDNDPTDSKKWSKATNIAQLLAMQGLYNEPEFDRLFRVTTSPVEYIRASALVGERLTHPHTKTLLNDRIVLVGYFLGSGLDIVATPLHGAIPGVFRHAMALDNLIQLDTGYWHMPTEDVVFGLDANDLIELLVNVGCIIIVLYVRERQIKFEEVRKRIDALNGMVKGKEKITDAEYQRFLTDQESLLVGKRDKNRRYLPLFMVPIILMAISIYISESVYTFGVANWYTLPLILLFSIPAFLSIVINNLRLSHVIRQISRQSEYFGMKASLTHRLSGLRHRITARNAKEKVCKE